MSLEQSEKDGTKSLIGRYEVIARIGVGGMAKVYKAVHLDLGREVALKVLPLETAARPESVERFRKEAQLAAKLRHENIVTLYEVGETAGTHFLAMEYVEGTDLQNYIKQKGKLDPEEARIFTIQATRALGLAHKFGIVHRDVKPSNLLMAAREGRYVIKLTDFGLARVVEDNDFQITRAGTTIGTVDYISPEQARNSRAADIRSDIYSLGCTLYHMLAGTPPFVGGDLTERLLKHVESDPEDVRSVNPKVPEGLALVLQRMMAKKPEDRYQTPAELLMDLENPPIGSSLSQRELLTALAHQTASRPARSSFGEVGKGNRPSPPVRPDSSQEKESPRRVPPRSSRSVQNRQMSDAEEMPKAGGEAWKIWLIFAALILGLAIFIIVRFILKN
jgi:serine/threonine-protein kinase